MVESWQERLLGISIGAGDLDRKIFEDREEDPSRFFWEC
jgi:hypothetical protein